MLEVLVNPDFRNVAVTDICNRAKISRPSYYRIMDRPEFQAELSEQCTRLTNYAVPGVIKALVAKAYRGDGEAMKMVLEMNGRYSQKHDLTLGAPSVIPVKLMGRLEQLSDEELRAIAGQNGAGGDASPSQWPADDGEEPEE